MNKIEIPYTELDNSQIIVNEQIISMLEIVENIKKICLEITDENIWSGSICSKFSEVSNDFNNYVDSKILDFKNTNEYKGYVSNKFFNHEITLKNKYNI